MSYASPLSRFASLRGPLLSVEGASSTSLEESFDDLSLRENSTEEKDLANSLKDKARNSVWRIKNPSIYGSGTAFAIGPNLFVTNLHVIFKILNNSDTVKEIVLEQEVNSSQLRIKRIIRLSAFYDLVLFETKENVINYLDVATHQPQSDDELFIFGYPDGKFKQIKKTVKLVEEGHGYSFPVNHSYLGGISGSPVLNGQGQIVGIASKASFNILFMMKSNDLNSLIAKNTGVNCSDFIELAMCFEEELDNLKNLAKQGDALVQYGLANVYKEILAEKDLNLALFWLQQSASQGHVGAQYDLAMMYLKSEGIEKDIVSAFFWLQQSASQGHALAQYDLAIMYYNGEGIEKKDPDIAVSWLQQSASQGYALAQYVLARKYYIADMAVRDDEMAFFWMRQSAFQGYAPGSI